MVKDNMFNEKVRRKEHGFFVESQALVIERRGRNKSKQYYNNNKPKDKSRGKSKSRKEIDCYHCVKTRHMKRICRKFKRKQSQTRGDEKKDQNDTTAVAIDNGDLIIVYDDDFVGFTGHDSNQLIDFGALFHITSHEDFFTSYTHGDLAMFRRGMMVYLRLWIWETFVQRPTHSTVWC